jgi:methionyl-tRNA formyltransferase
MNVVFMGSPEFAIPTLDALIHDSSFSVKAVFSQPDRPKGRGMKLLPTEVKVRASEAGIPVYTPFPWSTDEVISLLERYTPDVIVVVAFGKIIPEAVLDFPRYSSVNVHASLLPRWRGASPIQSAILHGDRTAGVTTMRMAKKLDAGPIYLQLETEINATDTAVTLQGRLSQMGADLLIKTLNQMRSGNLHEREQDETQVTYAPKLTKEMGWLDGSKKVTELDCQSRAFSPWPGSWVILPDRKKLKIHRLIPAQEHSLSEGVLMSQEGRLYMGCQDGSLEFLEVQNEGKKRQLANDWINEFIGKGGKFPVRLSKIPQ